MSKLIDITGKRYGHLTVVKRVGHQPWWGIRNHSQISNDIIRLRRELNTLNKLLNPWGD